MRFGVLVSGRGTNLGALIAARDAGTLAPAELAVVISNVPEAPALERASAAGIPKTVVDHRGLAREAFETKLLDVLAAHEVEAVVLAGFMRMLTTHFLASYPLRVINTHPSLLPAFPGIDAPAQAIAYGVKITGVTIHFVDASLDGGPIIAQAAVPVEAGDDAVSLHARIQLEEHRLLPECVRRFALGELACEGRVVTAKGARSRAE